MNSSQPWNNLNNKPTTSSALNSFAQKIERSETAARFLHLTSCLYLDTQVIATESFHLQYMKARSQRALNEISSTAMAVTEAELMQFALEPQLLDDNHRCTLAAFRLYEAGELSEAQLGGMLPAQDMQVLKKDVLLQLSKCCVLPQDDSSTIDNINAGVYKP